MKHASYHVLRVGLGITFLWIGILIIQNPLSWFENLLPWPQNLLDGWAIYIMYIIASMDLLIGLLLLVDIMLWLVALIGALHLITALFATGITALTVHDITLIAALIAVFLESKGPSKYLG